MMTQLYPLILAGGSGTRLWPLSRQNFPKQFLALNGAFSLLQQTLQRTLCLEAEQTFILSNDAHYFLCQEQLQIFNQPLQYLLEPCARNTAPAIACAAHHLAQTLGPEAMMLLLPSDHWIADEKAWKKAMQAAAEFAQAERAIVTFGIKPDSPKTGYGYLEAGPFLTQEVRTLLGFKEKPELEKAQTFLAQDNYFWNSGMFVCSAGLYLEELKKFEPEIYSFSQNALIQAQHCNDFIRLNLDDFSQCRAESIDYAVMEKTERAAIIPLNIQWSDLGCWTAVADANQSDEQGNTLSGKVITKNSYNCLINSEHILVTAVGIQDQIIVATQDAILVADKNYSQQIKELVHSLPQAHHQLTQDHQRVPRPWGHYEILAEGPAFKVKRLMIKPGAKLSLQMHQHRAEHWVVVSGQAEVLNNNQCFTLSVNQSTYIPPKTKHRLTNPGREPLYVIEVQSGTYLGEDDIKRFDDIYSRKDVALAEP